MKRTEKGNGKKYKNEHIRYFFSSCVVNVKNENFMKLVFWLEMSTKKQRRRSGVCLILIIVK